MVSVLDLTQTALSLLFISPGHVSGSGTSLGLGINFALGCVSLQDRDTWELILILAKCRV